MLQLFNTNGRIKAIRKSIIICGLLVFALLSVAPAVMAQQESEVDTATLTTDTTGLLPPVVEEVKTTDNSNTANNYFNTRSDTISVQQRTIPGEEIKKLKEDEDFWYANADIKQKKSSEQIAYEKEQGKKGQKEREEQALREQQQRNNNYIPLGQRSWFQTFLWVVILAVFATGLALYLGGSNIGLFRKKNVPVKTEGEEEITEDIFAINYQKEIDKAAAQGNYRLAIRLLFLRLLKNMAEKNIILYRQDKTNLDYLGELHPTHYYNNFFRVTRNYEYSWYGQFMVSEEVYKIIRSDFDQFDKELNN